MYNDLVRRSEDRDELDAALGDDAATKRRHQARLDAVRAAGGLED